MESDFKQSQQAQHLSTVSAEASRVHCSVWLPVDVRVIMWPHHCQQKEEGTCLGTALTAPDAAYVFSSSQLSTPEEGDTLQ